MPNLPLIPAPNAPRVDRKWGDAHVDECFVCGRPLTTQGITCFVEFTTDGYIVPVGREVENSQGCYPVGSTCAKQVPKEYRLTRKSHPSLYEGL